MQAHEDIPGAVRDFLGAAGTLDEVPWDGRTAIDPSDSFCRPPPPQSTWDDSSDKADSDDGGVFDPTLLTEADWQELLAGGDLGGGEDPDESDSELRESVVEDPEVGGATGGRRRFLDKPVQAREDGVDLGDDDEFMPGVRPRLCLPARCEEARMWGPWQVIAAQPELYR